ncbi:MAG: hypothetical protein EXR50_05535 [Dehalococcoidia bacterium]|nr:hypothetical protein [Dehalococcoidia bacterium]
MAKINRREFLKLTVLAGGAVFILPKLEKISSVDTALGAAEPQIMAGNWTLSKDDVLEVRSGPPDGVSPSFGVLSSTGSRSYVSPVLIADFPFNAVGASWDGPITEGNEQLIMVRASEDSSAWSPWISMEEIDQFRGLKHNTTDLAILSGQYLQMKMVVGSLTPDVPEGRREVDGSSEPEAAPWEKVTITYINSLQGPTTADAVNDAGNEFGVSALARNTVIPRSGWGANESVRFSKEGMIWPPTYSPAKSIFIHHSATSDGGADPAAIIRAIYYYHTVTNKWGDIGYNFLIDKSGNIYEGRYGGPNVIAAHTFGFNTGSVGICIIGNDDTDKPPGAVMNALGSLTLEKSVQHGINPLGSFVKNGKTYSNISGHKDAFATSCPGQYLYSLLPSLKQSVKQNAPPFAVAWVSTKIARSAVAQGATTNLSMIITNSGTEVLKASGSGRSIVNYTWLRQDGSPYSESGINGTTSLPKDIAPFETTSITATITAPSNIGQYILRLDVSRDGTGSLASQGIRTSDIGLRVASQSSISTFKSFFPVMTNKNSLLSGRGGAKAP